MAERPRRLRAAVGAVGAFIAMVAMAAMAAIGAAHAGPVRITDDRGVTLTLPATPRRIVSLLPSLTETICALGECARLVGVDRYSNFPEPVRRLPQVGGGIDPNIEAVVALRPDVVLLAGSSRAVRRFEQLGLKVATLEPRNAADVQRVLLQLGALLEVPDAQRISRDIDAAVDRAVRSMPPGAAGTRVYFEVGGGPYAAGRTSYVGQVMARLGLENIVPEALGPFPKINPEFVVRANPGVVMTSERNALGMAQRPGWPGIDALKNRRVCAFTPEQGDVLVRAGPRMAEAAQLLVQCIQGGLK